MAQPLLWSDAKGLTRFSQDPASVEAVWSENGAVCLDAFRLRQQEAAIAAHCKRPPRCSTDAGSSHGHVTSAHPH